MEDNKMALNDRQIVKVKMFGKFSVEYKSKQLSYDDMRSEMVTKLLAYILVNNSKVISVQELIDVLWVDDEIINPIGALKNLVYRLRNILKKKLEILSISSI